MDIINCGSNYALLELNVGMIGHTMIHANKIFPYFPAKWLRKNIGLAYTLAGIKALTNFSLMKQKYTITMDGTDISGNYCNIQVSNTACNGGNLTPNPYAIPDDGFLNAIFVMCNRVLKIISTLSNYNKGLFEKYSIFNQKTFKSMEIHSEEILHIEMDGEGFYSKDFTMSIVPNGIRVFAPEGLDFLDHSYKAYRAKEKTGGTKT
jgi:diacylglycerol kinase family enzyme